MLCVVLVGCGEGASEWLCLFVDNIMCVDYGMLLVP